MQDMFFLKIELASAAPFMATLFALKICNSATPPPPPGGGTQQSVTGGGSFPKANPLPFYIPLLTKRAPLSYTFY